MSKQYVGGYSLRHHILNIARFGSKSWVRRIVTDRRRRDIGLASYPTVCLSQAPSLTAANRSAVAGVRNPLGKSGNPKEATRTPAPSIPIFADAAARVIELRHST